MPASMPAPFTKKIWGTLDAFVEGGDILGRKVANTAFLKALLQEDPYDEYHFFLQNQQAKQSLANWLTSNFPALLEAKKIRFESPLELHKHLANIPYHCFHLSDFLTHQASLINLRNVFACNTFPVTGLTHSLSYSRYMPRFLEHFWAGNTPKDVIIATSRSAKAMLTKTFAHIHKNYENKACTHLAPSLDEKIFPQVHIIPLGVNPEEFPTPSQRWYAESGQENSPALTFREKSGIGEKLVFLCLGRISHFSKMDFMPVIAAFKRAESLGLPAKAYVLVLAGFANSEDKLPETLQNYAKSQGIELIVIVNPDNKLRQTLYASADIFISPADSLQETFGLTVIEAGISGLPVIVSDFNGYKDTVMHKHTGFLVPTIGLEDTKSNNALSRLWFDNQYHFKLSQSTVVHVPQMAEHIVELALNKKLRRRMGENARKHCLDNFSWQKVIKKYVQLWDSLAQLTTPTNCHNAEHPLAVDFGDFFASHYSTHLNRDILESKSIRLTTKGNAVFRKTLPAMPYAGLESFIDEEQLHYLLLVARKEILLSTAVGKMLAARKAKNLQSTKFAQEETLALILWCLKHDYVEFTETLAVKLAYIEEDNLQGQFLPNPVFEVTTHLQSDAEHKTMPTSPPEDSKAQIREMLHDINTPLAIIHGAGELILETLNDDEISQSNVKEMIKAAKMIGKHVENIKIIASKLK